MIKSLRKWVLLWFYFFSRKVEVPKMQSIVQGHYEVFQWCLELEVELAKKRYTVRSRGNNAIKWLGPVLGGLTCHGTGRCWALSKSGLRCSQGDHKPWCLLSKMPLSTTCRQCQPAHWGPAAVLVCMRIPHLEIWGMSGYARSSCSPCYCWTSLCGGELWLWCMSDFLAPVFWLLVKFVCVKSSNST